MPVKSTNAGKRRRLPVLGCTLPPSLVEKHARLFTANALQPEFFMTAEQVTASSRHIIDRARDFADRQGGCTFHAPFSGLSPGSKSASLRKHSIDILLASAERAASLGARSAVLHSGFNPDEHDSYDAWMSLACPGLSLITERFAGYGVRPLVENCHEPSPALLLKLLENLDPSTMFCFDPPHAVLATDVSVEEWLAATGDYVYEVHLHNNHRDTDEHLAVDDGDAWNVRMVLRRLLESNSQFIPVLEPPDEQTAVKSLAALERWRLYPPAAAQPAT